MGIRNPVASKYLLVKWQSILYPLSPCDTDVMASDRRCTTLSFIGLFAQFEPKRRVIGERTKPGKERRGHKRQIVKEKRGERKKV